MNDDENKNILNKIKTRYVNSNKIPFFSLEFPFPSPPAYLRLDNNFSKFVIARRSYKIPERIKEILEQLRLNKEKDEEEDKKEDKEEDKKEVKEKDKEEDKKEDKEKDEEEDKKENKEEDEEEDEEEEEEKEDEEEEEEVDKKEVKEKDKEEDEKEDEKEDENTNKKTDEIIDETNNKDGVLKEDNNAILKELDKINKEYSNICVKAYDDCSYYKKVFGKLYRDYDKHYHKKDVSKIYDKITTDIIIKLNNNYQKYEKEFINMVDSLNDLKNKII